MNTRIFREVGGKCARMRAAIRFAYSDNSGSRSTCTLRSNCSASISPKSVSRSGLNIFVAAGAMSGGGAGQACCARELVARITTANPRAATETRLRRRSMGLLYHFNTYDGRVLPLKRSMSRKFWGPDCTCLQQSNGKPHQIASMNRKPSHSNRRLIVASTILATFALFSFAPARATLAQAAAQTRARKHTAPTPAAKPSPKATTVPFRPGEKLDYNVAWSSFTTAASVELSIPEQRDLYGWHTWHFRATAHTVSPVRTLFPIDDEFDSYT